jgi:hypothetical protein
LENAVNVLLSDSCLSHKGLGQARDKAGTKWTLKALQFETEAVWKKKEAAKPPSSFLPGSGTGSFVRDGSVQEFGQTKFNLDTICSLLLARRVPFGFGR